MAKFPPVCSLYKQVSPSPVASFLQLSSLMSRIVLSVLTAKFIASFYRMFVVRLQYILAVKYCICMLQRSSADC